MRKRSYSLDQILEPGNEFGPESPGKEEKRSETFIQMHCRTLISFVYMHWKRMEIICMFQYDAFRNFVTGLNSNYGKQIKQGRLSLIYRL